MAIDGAINIARKVAANSVRLCCAASPDGFHSSSRLWANNMRHAVRTIASKLKQAS